MIQFGDEKYREGESLDDAAANRERASKIFTGTGKDDARNEKLRCAEMLRREGETQDECLRDIREHDLKEHDSTDPYSRLGFGWVAYFNMLWVYTCLFLFFTILCLPVFSLFKKGEGLIYSNG